MVMLLDFGYVLWTTRQSAWDKFQVGLFNDVKRRIQKKHSIFMMSQPEYVPFESMEISVYGNMSAQVRVYQDKDLKIHRNIEFSGFYDFLYQVDDIEWNSYNHVPDGSRYQNRPRNYVNRHHHLDRISNLTPLKERKGKEHSWDVSTARSVQDLLNGDEKEKGTGLATRDAYELADKSHKKNIVVLRKRG